LKDSTTIAVTIILIAVIILAGGSVIAFFGNLGDVVADWLRGVTDGAGDVGMGLIIEFTDGTSEEVNPDDMTAFTVYWDGKEVDSIIGVPQYRLTYEGQLKSNTVYHNHSKWFDGELIEWQTPTPDTTTPASNVWQGVSLAGSASEFGQGQIENLDNGEYTTHTLELRVHLKMDVELAGEPVQTLEGTAWATVTVSVEQVEVTLETRVTPIEFRIYRVSLHP